MENNQNLNNMKDYPMGGGTQKFGWIQTLRGVAAFLVFFSHQISLPIPRNLMFIIGRVGVTCFFLISGYLAISTRKKRNRRQYLINRFVRMYPVYWFILGVTFVLYYSKWSLKELMINMTLFEEFFGYDAILGSSWMMPIQVILFIGLLILGTRFFIPSPNNERNSKRGMLLMIICMLGAIATGFIRLKTNKPFPVAIFLLLGVAMIGIYYRESEKAQPLHCIIRMRRMVIIFEVGLVFSTLLGYKGDWILYFASYNIGISMFVLFQIVKIYNCQINKLFDKLGNIGFTFFLAGEIPLFVLNKIFPSERSLPITIVFVLLNCVLLFFISLLISNYIEKPIINLGHKLEKCVE